MNDTNQAPDTTLHSLPAPVGDRQLASLWEQLCEEKRLRIAAEMERDALRAQMNATENCKTMLRPNRLNDCRGYGNPFAEACCERAGEYNGFAGDGPLAFRCPKGCSCHD